MISLVLQVAIANQDPIPATPLPQTIFPFAYQTTAEGTTRTFIQDRSENITEVTGLGKINQIIVSPNGRQYAMIATKDDEDSLTIHELILKKGPTTVTTDKPNTLKNVAWSPDSTRIVFEREVSDDKTIEAYNVTKSEKPTILFSTEPNSPFLNPRFDATGNQVVWVWDNGLMAYSLVTSGISTLDKKKLFADLPLYTFDSFQPVPARQGVYITAMTLNLKVKALMLLDTNEKSLSRITPVGLAAHSPMVTSDPRRIAFIGSPEGDPASYLYTVRVDGKDVQRHNKISE